MLSQLGEKLGDAILPKADFSIGDIIEEVRSLREENAALKAQVAILSQPGGAAAGAAQPQVVGAGSAAVVIQVFIGLFRGRRIIFGLCWLRVCQANGAKA